MKLSLAVAQRFQRPDRVHNIIAIGAGTTAPLAHMTHLLIEREPARILCVPPVDDETQRPHLPPVGVFKLDPPRRFQINGRHLLARANTPRSHRSPRR